MDDRGMVVGIIDARMRWMSGSIWGKRGKEGGSVIWKDPSALVKADHVGASDPAAPLLSVRCRAQSLVIPLGSGNLELSDF